MSNYTVNYGVNNSHTTEMNTFKLYKDAVAFYETLDKVRYPAGYICKLIYTDGYCSKRIAKQYYNEQGTNHHLWLTALDLI